MSLFQCDKCGCLENTALTGAPFDFLRHFINDTKQPVVAKSYREVMSVPLDKELGNYCSACNPIWYGEDKKYGVGPNPNPTSGYGLWHGKFKREFLPKGFFETDPKGDLWQKNTHEPPKAYFSNTEWPTLQQAVQEAFENALVNGYEEVREGDLKQTAISMMDQDSTIESMTGDGFHTMKEVVDLIAKCRAPNPAKLGNIVECSDRRPWHCYSCNGHPGPFQLKDATFLQAWPTYRQDKRNARLKHGSSEGLRSLLICFNCLEASLGRKLVPTDFDFSIPINMGIALGIAMGKGEA